MPDDLESIGGLAVSIGADYSQMMSDFSAAQGLAADAGNKIAESFNTSAAAGATLEEKVQALIDKGMTLAEALAVVNASAEGVAAGASEAGAAVESAAAQMSLFGEAASVPFADASGQLNLFSTELEHFEGASQTGQIALRNIGQEAEKITPPVQSATGAFDELGGILTGLAAKLGVLIGVKQFVTETFEAFSRLQDATVAMTALTGSAAAAAGQIEQVRRLATTENLSFPQLLEATQRMDAFGFSTQLIPDALNAAATAAVATNRSIDQTANAFERMAAAGMASGRQLASLGLTTDDLAQVMGTLDSGVSKTFKDLEENTRLAVVSMAEMQKHSTLLGDSADTLSRQWQGMKNTFEKFFSTLGSAVEPFASAIVHWFGELGKAAEAFTLAIEVNFEKLEFYFDKFTGQINAANAKAQEINANAQKFRDLVTGAGSAAGEATRVFTQEGFAKEFNQDLKTQQWEAATKLIQQLAKTDLPEAQAAMKRLVEAEYEAAEAAKKHKEVREQFEHGIKQTRGELAFWIDEEKLEVAQQESTTKAISAYGEAHLRAGEDLDYAAAKQGYFAEQVASANDKIEKQLRDAPNVTKELHLLGIGAQKAGEAQKDFTAIMTSVGIAVDQAMPKLDAAGELMAKLDRAFDIGNLSQAEALIRRLAVEDLPDATRYQDAYVNALERTHASQERINAAVKEQMALHEQLAITQKKSATEYQVGLAVSELYTRNLGFTTQRVLGTMATEAIFEVDKALGQMSQQFAKLIVEGGSFGKVMHQIFNQIAETILSVLINAIVKLAEEFLLQKLTQRAISGAENVAEILSTAPVAAAHAFASTAAIPIIGPELAPAAAAAASGFVSALAPLAEFEEGGFVNETMLALVHKGEFVVPAKDVQAGGNLSPGGLSIQIGSLHGVTRDTADALAELIFRKARLAGAFS